MNQEEKKRKERVARLIDERWASIKMKREDKKQEEKLADFIERAYDDNNGRKLRQIVKNFATLYQNDPESLRTNCDSDYEKVAGVATSAYYHLTGDIKPIQERGYGGLGVTIRVSEPGLEFGRSQLHYARLGGTALQFSKNSNLALWMSKNAGYALQGSVNTDLALMGSVNYGNSLQKSRNDECALAYSCNFRNALQQSKNSGDALKNSRNFRNALQDSANRDNALEFSINRADALKNSSNENSAVYYSSNIWRG
jgi:hypothetical protein